ncbi:MFS transporter [Actinomadura syzygii]|nr:MFS transporter [Actinomadura syzygii]
MENGPRRCWRPRPPPSSSSRWTWPWSTSRCPPSGVNAAGGALGVLAGGVLTEYAGWRWVMFVNLPIVAVALALVPAGVRESRNPGPRERMDVLGAVLATSGIGLLVFGVVRTDVRGWTSAATLGTLAAAFALLAAFVAVEARVRSPLVRLGLLRSRWVGGANVIVFLAAAGQFAGFYFVSLYMQEVLGMGAAATGAAFLPFSAGVVLGTVAAAATTGVAAREGGMASGLLNSSRQLGGCVGVAALATVAAHRTGTGTSPAALNDGFALSLAVGAGLFVPAALVAVALPRRAAGGSSAAVAEPRLERTR